MAALPVELGNEQVPTKLSLDVAHAGREERVDEKDHAIPVPRGSCAVARGRIVGPPVGPLTTFAVVLAIVWR
eukprot:3128826-Heterocapsa_arctica.AAC.1